MTGPATTPATVTTAGAGLLTVTWTQGNIRHRSVVTRAIITAEIRVILMLEETEQHANGEQGRTVMRITGGPLTVDGVHLDNDERSSDRLTAALHPVLTFDRALDLLAATDPTDLSSSEREVEVLALTLALRHVPAGLPRHLGLTLLTAGFTGTPDELVTAIAAATNS